MKTISKCLVGGFLGLVLCSNAYAGILIQDDFEDGIIDTTKWIYGGHDVIESQGIIDLQRNVTDGGGWLKTVQFPPVDNIQIKVRHYMHAGGSNYYPTFLIETIDGSGFMYIEYQKSSYSGNYCYNSVNYNKIVVKDAGPFGSNCFLVSDVSASDYYDKWITSYLTYDAISGEISVDIGNDGILEVAGTVPIERRSAINRLFISSSGWYTGHYHKIDWIEITSIPANTDPISDAGPDQAIIQIGTTVQLEGTQSWDPEGDPITYNWTIVTKPAGSSAALSDQTSPTPTFQADIHGEYVIELVVSDGSTSSASDQVIVTFDNAVPVANAGSNQSVVQGDQVCFDGNGSMDDNGDFLFFRWSLDTPNGSTASLDDPSAKIPCLTTDLPGSYEATLIVNDGWVDSPPSSASAYATSYQDATTATLQESIETVNNIPLDDLKNKNMQNSLTNKVNAALELIEQGAYSEALDKLQNDLLGKTDGCATSGSPDKNDWIEDCTSQGQVYPLLIEAIDHVKSLRVSELVDLTSRTQIGEQLANYIEYFETNNLFNLLPLTGAYGSTDAGWVEKQTMEGNSLLCEFAEVSIDLDSEVANDIELTSTLIHEITHYRDAVVASQNSPYELNAGDTEIRAHANEYIYFLEAISNSDYSFELYNALDLVQRTAMETCWRYTMGIATKEEAINSLLAGNRYSQEYIDNTLSFICVAPY